MINGNLKRRLVSLHKKAAVGDDARAERDELIYALCEDGATQTELARVLTDAGPPASRNSVQKIVQRQRKANGQ